MSCAEQTSWAPACTPPPPCRPPPQVSRNDESQTTPRRAAGAAFHSQQLAQRQQQQQQKQQLQPQANGDGAAGLQGSPRMLNADTTTSESAGRRASKQASTSICACR